MFNAYRVLRDFGWDGWQYAESPYGNCSCDCWHRKQRSAILCTRQVGSQCNCDLIHCFCTCTLKKGSFAGDIWIVQEGHPKLEQMLRLRFAIYDSSLPPIKELLRDPQYERLTRPYAT